MPQITLILETCGGLTGGMVMVAAVDVNGAPVFFRIAGGAFDGAGRIGVRGTVPPGLSGLRVGFQSYGFYASGTLGVSDVEQLSFQ